MPFNYRTLIGTSTVQYILASTYVAIGLRLLIEGFIHTENVSNGAFLYWIDPEIRTQVIEKFIYFTNVRGLYQQHSLKFISHAWQTVIGDWVLIWRVYMVWGQNIYICIPPIILTCCSMGESTSSCLDNHPDLVYRHRIHRPRESQSDHCRGPNKRFRNPELDYIQFEPYYGYAGDLNGDDCWKDMVACKRQSCVQVSLYVAHRNCCRIWSHIDPIINIFTCMRRAQDPGGCHSS